jgi:hypothetical protein
MQRQDAMRSLLVLAVSTILMCGAMGCNHTGGERAGCATCGNGGGGPIVAQPATQEPPVKMAE